MPELKPCPFCGRMVYATTSYIAYGFTIVADHKKSCFFYGTHAPVFETMKKAVSSWNRRAGDNDCEVKR